MPIKRISRPRLVYPRKRAGEAYGDVRNVAIEPATLEATISRDPVPDHANIPLSRSFDDRTFPELFDLAWDLMMDDVIARNEKRGIFVAYRFDVPDPWLLAMAYLMWQGLIQGLTWDATKLLVKGALRKLRAAGVAPALRPPPRDEESSFEIGFSWESYARDTDEQHKLFLGLRRAYRGMTPRKRAKLAAIPRGPKPSPAGRGRTPGKKATSRATRRRE